MMASGRGASHVPPAHDAVSCLQIKFKICFWSQKVRRQGPQTENTRFHKSRRTFSSHTPQRQRSLLSFDRPTSDHIFSLRGKSGQPPKDTSPLGPVSPSLCSSIFTAGYLWSHYVPLP